MNTQKLSLAVIIGTALLLLSCKEDIRQTIGGYNYQIIESNKGVYPEVGMYVYYHVTSHVDDKIVKTSRKNDFPQVFQIQEEEQLKRMESPFLEVLGFMSEGDSAIVIQSLENVRRIPEEFKGASSITYGVKLIRLLTQEEYDEDKANQRQLTNQIKESYRTKAEEVEKMMEAFFQQTKEIRMKDFTETATGLKYKVLNKVENSTKPQSKEDLVDLSYVGYRLDGEKLGSSYTFGTPHRFRVGSDNAMPGWNEMVTLISKGEKAIVFIPAHLAYGERNFKGDVDIPANSDLIFYFELENILPAMAE